MENMDADKDSVNSLINKLCLGILKQYEDVLTQTEIQAAVPKLKALSFEILLKKSPRPKTISALEENKDFEPQRAFDIQIFAAKLNSRANPQVCAKFAEFEDRLEAIKNDPYFTEGCGKGVLQLLLALQGNVHEEYEVPNMCPPELLVPGPFTLHANYQNNPHYPKLNDYDLLNPKPKFFKGIQPLKSADNPYLPRFLFEGEKDQLKAIDNKYATTTEKKEDSLQCTFTGMTKRLFGDILRINTSSLRLIPEVNKQAPKPFKFIGSPRGQIIVNSNHIEDDQQRKKIYSWNWEGLDCFGLTCSKSFAGDASVSLLIKTKLNKDHKLPFEAFILKLEDFIKDLKSLTVGIQSDTFQHDEHLVFSMKQNVTVEGVLPAVLKNFVADFLECGTCYKRLQTMIMKRDYKLMFEGFMFKALCSAIDEYLLTFRQFVFSKQDEYLLGFYKRMQKMIKQIINLSCTLAIHPKVEANVKPPMGSQFLGYLYREIMRLTQEDYIALLIFIFRRCCHVYFKHLQKWIFYGILDDSCNELFVGFMDHYRENTKYFYDKAYFIRKESVPGFFHNFDEQILQCGKYTMLLKAYKPNHPLFDLECPPLSVCLSVDDVEKLHSVCTKYYENASKVCPKALTIREFFEIRAGEKRKFFQRMVERSKENLERWTEEQHELAIMLAEKKKKRLEDLSAQLQDAKERKVQERKANVEMELKYLKEMERAEEQRLIKDNINLRKRIEYYQELSDIIKEKENAKEKCKDNKSKLCLQIPSTSTQQGSPRTPASTAETDFQSCCGDDDEQSSEYEECSSDDLVDKFEQTEKDLKSIYGENEDEVIQKTEESKTQKEEKNSNLVNTFLKRSISDVINCNEVPSRMITNRDKAMSGASMEQCMKTLEVNVNTKTPNAAIIDNANTTTKTQLEIPMTVAQRNKQKVLTEEYNLVQQTAHTKSMPDINLNTTTDENLTELQRNRRRMMHNDLFCEYNKDPLEARTNLYLNLDSERARNRQKVLSSEYDILTGKNTAIAAITPMSTSSDATPITESLSGCQADEDNGNIQIKPIDAEPNEDFEKRNLKLNVSLANRDIAKELTLPTPGTLPDTTPDFALNTAGVMAKKGFSFPNAEKKLQQRQQVTNVSVQLEENWPEPDYTDPYKRCRELIETNFKCKSISPYIRLNNPSTNPKNIAKDSKQASVNVTTITEFLQKSVIIPMSTHLELINSEVMRLFLQDLKVLDHFRSLRNYYFMMDGEFGSIICDGIIGRLENGVKPEKLLNYQILHSILDAALGSSITGKDKNAENLSFIVDDVPETFEINSPDVLSNLSLSYRISWPLNLILNPETLEQYAHIFKYLVRVRRISWILERAYQILKECVKQHGSAILKSPQYRHVQFMRHKFYHFVHALQNHITANALQASWKTFKDTLLSAKTIEDIYRKHTTYIKRILFLCMLNRKSAEFYNTIENVFKISIRFYNNLKSREFKLKQGHEHFTHSRYEKLINDEVEFDKFIKYTIYLGNKIVQHGYQAEIGEFISLINYNHYYMKNIP